MSQEPVPAPGGQQARLQQMLADPVGYFARARARARADAEARAQVRADVQATHRRARHA